MQFTDSRIEFLLKDKDLQNPKSFEDLGYMFFGPLLFNFFEWLKPSLTDCDLVLFNSREGYFLIQIYELFKEKYNLPKYEYFKTSRKISSVASIFDKNDIYKTFELHRYSGKLSHLLENRFGIKVKVDNDYNIDTLQKIPNIDKYMEQILKNSGRARVEYEKYVKNIIGNSTNIVMVDSGYQGTTQYNIEKTFDINCKGRYITYKGNLDIKDAKGFCDFHKGYFKDNIVFFESVFTDKVGTYIDIIDGKFQNENIEIKFFDEKQNIVNGIKQFVIECFNYNTDDVISYEYSDYIFNLMCKKDYIKNDKLFDIFTHDNYYVKNVIKKIERK